MTLLLRLFLSYWHESSHGTIDLDPVTLRQGEDYTARECLSQPGPVHRVDAETVARERLFAEREQRLAQMGVSQ
jgi:hypothetical protein